MISRILVPLDGSELAEQAIPAAAKIAKNTHASIRLIRVVPFPTYYGPYVVATGDEVNNVVEAEEHGAKVYLAHVTKSERFGGLNVTAGVKIGAPGPCIDEEALAQGSDLIVMASHGRTGFSRWMLGSVAVHVARHSTVPLLVVRTSEHQHQTLPNLTVDHLPRVLIGLDGSLLAEQALAPAIEIITALAAPRKPVVHLLQVIDWLPEKESSGLREQAVTQAKRYLSGSATRLETEYGDKLALPVQLSTVIDQDAASALLRTAEVGESAEGGAPAAAVDVIALATHGRTGVLRWTMGSITERVLQSARLPLLVVHAASIPAQPR